MHAPLRRVERRTAAEIDTIRSNNKQLDVTCKQPQLEEKRAT
jgi:hypothetical protein